MSSHAAFPNRWMQSLGISEFAVHPENTLNVDSLSILNFWVKEVCLPTTMDSRASLTTALFSAYLLVGWWDYLVVWGK
jgi:hypothetical protein